MAIDFAGVTDQVFKKHHSHIKGVTSPQLLVLDRLHQRYMGTISADLRTWYSEGFDFYRSLIFGLTTGKEKA